MAAYERVLVEIAAGIGSVTLNRPEKLNAFDRAMCDELLEALRLLSGSEGVRVITITGAGRAFCAGADLSVLGADGASLVAAGKDVALTIRSPSNSKMTFKTPWVAGCCGPMLRSSSSVRSVGKLALPGCSGSATL